MLKIYLFTFFLISSCGRFNLSPYISETSNVNQNKKAQEQITQRESLFTNTFKIAVISDSHDYYSELQKTVDYINSKKDDYAFVIITGDLTNIGLLSEFKTAKKIYDQLNIPYLTTIGNHDLLTNGAEIFKQLFGDDTFSFEFKQTKFVLYNNNNWENPYPVPDLSWIEKEISTSSKTHNILFSHVSAMDTARFTSEEIAAFQAMTDKYAVPYQINGHDHNFGYKAFGNSTRVTVGSPSKKVFVELSISDSGVTHAFIHP